jgi:hypothetical protein
MAPILTLAQMRESVETDLPDAALQRLIDAEDAEIVRRYGAPATQTQVLRGGSASLYLSRQASAITSVSEEVGGTVTALAADDYELWSGGILEREADGTNGRAAWGERVTVVYVPVADAEQRTACLAQLVQLAVRYSGVASESIGGDYSATKHDYQRERERLLRKLAPRGGMVIA